MSRSSGVDSDVDALTAALRLRFSHSTPERPRPEPGRAAAGEGRRGHLRKLSLELQPEDHDRLKVWIISAFGGDTAAASVLRALLAEAYADPALTERVRRRLEPATMA